MPPQRPLSVKSSAAGAVKVWQPVKKSAEKMMKHSGLVASQHLSV